MNSLFSHRLGLVWALLQRPMCCKYNGSEVFGYLRGGVYGSLDRSAGKGVCCQAWWPWLDSWDPCGGRRELTSAICPELGKSIEQAKLCVFRQGTVYDVNQHRRTQLTMAPLPGQEILNYMRQWQVEKRDLVSKQECVYSLFLLDCGCHVTSLFRSLPWLPLNEDCDLKVEANKDSSSWVAFG